MAFSIHVFDAYGTLFDVHAAVRRHAEALGPDAAALSETWRVKQLEYSWVHALMDRYEPFWTLTERALDFAFRKYPSADRALRDALLDAYRSLDSYPEVARVLSDLKAAGSRTAILSNGSPDMLASAVRSAGLEDLLDDVFSVETVRVFKTAPATYELVTNHYRVFPEVVSFQSSNRWDIAGATAFGFRTVWINRSGAPDEYEAQAPVAVLPSLEGLVGLDA